MIPLEIVETKFLEITARNNIPKFFLYVSCSEHLKAVKVLSTQDLIRSSSFRQGCSVPLANVWFFPLLVGFQVLAGLSEKAFQCFCSAVRKSEEEVQSHSMDHVDVVGVVDAYMTLISFCDQYLRREEEGLLG